jgi:hypothetical protein
VSLAVAAALHARIAFGDAGTLNGVSGKAAVRRTTGCSRAARIRAPGEYYGGDWYFIFFISLKRFPNPQQEYRNP